MIEVATTGPFHSRIAGIANPVVLPVCVGPITIADCLDSAASSRPAARPRIRRPGSVVADAEWAEVAWAGPPCGAWHFVAVAQAADEKQSDRRERAGTRRRSVP